MSLPLNLRILEVAREDTFVESIEKNMLVEMPEMERVRISCVLSSFWLQTKLFTELKVSKKIHTHEALQLFVYVIMHLKHSGYFKMLDSSLSLEAKIWKGKIVLFLIWKTVKNYLWFSLCKLNFLLSPFPARMLRRQG